METFQEHYARILTSDYEIDDEPQEHEETVLAEFERCRSEIWDDDHTIFWDEPGNFMMFPTYPSIRQEYGLTVRIPSLDVVRRILRRLRPYSIIISLIIGYPGLLRNFNVNDEPDDPEEEYYYPPDTEESVNEYLNKPYIRFLRWLGVVKVDASLYIRRRDIYRTEYHGGDDEIQRRNSF